MLKIRMKRAGGKNHPFFRVVVIDSRRARDSRAVEELGYYNPLEDPMVVNVNRERVTFWVGQGAQVSDSVRTLLRRENSTHQSRRVQESFEPMLPEDRPPAKSKKPRAQAAAQPTVAVQEREVPEEEATETTPQAGPVDADEDTEA